MATYRKTRAEALRATVQVTQEQALAALQGDDLREYHATLEGENKWISMLGYHPSIKVGSPLYNAVAYLVADFMELQDAIKGLKISPESLTPGGGAGNSNPLTPLLGAGSSAPPPMPSKPTLPGGLRKSIASSSISSSDVDTGTTSDDPNNLDIKVPGALKAPPLLPTTMEEVGAIFDKWEQRYGPAKGALACTLVELSLKERLPDVLELLLDKHWLNEKTLAYKRVPVPGKVYPNVHEQPREYYHVAQHIVQSRMTPMIMKLVCHAKMQDILPKMYVEDVLFLVRFAFDTRNQDMMRELLSDRLNIPLNKLVSSSADNAGAPILVDCAYRATKEDFPCLDLLIDRGVDLNSYDQYSSTPVISAARAGNGAYLGYLMNHRGVDLTMQTFNNETLADVLANSPALRVSQQREYEARMVRINEMYESQLATWRVECAQADARGLKRPQEPRKPKDTGRPAEFDIHHLLLAQEAVESIGANIELTRKKVNPNTTSVAVSAADNDLYHLDDGLDF